jgi:virginiamycin B lyase
LTTGSEPWGVAISGTGANTVVWFTERAGNRIGKFIPASGHLIEFTVPTTGAQPSGIALYGSDVWFTETAANKLGLLWMSTGQIVELAAFLDPPLSSPQDVAVVVIGGVSNPWISEMDGDKITLFYRSTTGGWNRVLVPTAGSEPFGIAVEGDTAVWFTERDANKLGRYTGPIPPSEYPLPTPNSLPTDIVVDDGGCAWYTAPGANRIGRLCLPLGIYLPLALKRHTMDFGR